MIGLQFGRYLNSLSQKQAKHLSKIFSQVQACSWSKMFCTVIVLLKKWNSTFSIAYVRMKTSFSFFYKSVCFTVSLFPWFQVHILLFWLSLKQMEKKQTKSSDCGILHKTREGIILAMSKLVKVGETSSIASYCCWIWFDTLCIKTYII